MTENKMSLSTMADWVVFEECMDLGALNCEEAEPYDTYHRCRALHEDPEMLYEHSFSQFGREIFEFYIRFEKHPDHLQFQDGRVILMPADDSGRRELRPEGAPEDPTYLYWLEENGRCFISE